jgi:hypothetical protein
MSDHFVRFIPLDPRFVPTQRAQKAAVTILRSAVPRADDVSSDADEQIAFRDCGENFERIECPACHKKIAVGAWLKWMDADYSRNGGFRLKPLTTPCCRTTTTLNDLVYDWPQGFSRYALSAMNINKRLPSTVLKKLEAVLRCKLRVIRQML